MTVSIKIMEFLCRSVSKCARVGAGNVNTYNGEIFLCFSLYLMLQSFPRQNHQKQLFLISPPFFSVTPLKIKNAYSEQYHHQPNDDSVAREHKASF